MQSFDYLQELGALAATPGDAATDGAALARAVFEHSAIGIAVTDEAGRYVRTNGAFQRLLGYDADELADLGFPDVTVEADRATNVERYRALMRGELASFELEKCCRRKSGEVIRVRVTVCAHAPRAGGGRLGIAIIEDITDRHLAEQRLRESERWYRLLFEGTDDALVVFGIDEQGRAGRFVTVNDAACRLLLHPRERLLGLSPGELDVSPVPLDPATMLSGFAREGKFRVARDLLRGDSGAVPVDMLMTPFGRSGTRTVLASLRDVSEERRAYQALRDSESRFRALAQVAPVGIVRSDASGGYQYVNERWCEITGLAVGDALGQGWLQALHPADRSIVSRAWEWAVRHHEPFALEYRLQRPDGIVTWVLGQAATVRDEAGRIRGYVGTTTDISVPRAAADLLQRSEQELRSIIDSTAAAIYVKDAGGRYLRANRCCLELFGVPETRLLGATDRDLLPAAIAERIARNDARVLETGTALQTEEEVDFGRGPRAFLSVKVPLLDLEGRPYALCGISTDITERKLARAELEQANASLRRLSQQLLDVQEEERRRLSRELHDDIGQSLAALRLALESTRRRHGNAHVDECISIADAIQARVRSLSGDLRPAQLDDLGIEATLRAFLDARAGQAGFAVHYTSLMRGARPGGPVEIACFRIVQEAWNNAVRHARPREFRVSLERIGNDLGLHVSDDGCGFDPARPVPVRGLGLDSMRERVRRLGGSFSIDSRPGAGTRIAVGLPGAFSGADRSPPGSANLRAVVIDDHDLVRAGIRAVLGGIEGVSIVAEASESAAAAALVEAHAANLLITDIDPGAHEGKGPAEALAGSREDLRVVVLSMHTGHDLVMRALRAGASAYVAKARAMTELEPAIRAVQRGDVYLSPGLSHTIALQAARGEEGVEALPARQREILGLVAEGCNTKEIAARLGLSPKTVDAHRLKLMRRVGARDLAGLVRYALRTVPGATSRG